MDYKAENQVYESRFNSFQLKEHQAVSNKPNPLSNRSQTLALENKIKQASNKAKIINLPFAGIQENSEEEEKYPVHSKPVKLFSQKIGNNPIGLQVKDSNCINKKQNFFEMRDSNSNSKKSNSTPGFMRTTKKCLNANKIKFFRDTPFVSYVHPKRYIYEFATHPEFKNFKEKYFKCVEEIEKLEVPNHRQIKLGRINSSASNEPK